jgi:hypothetical protein
VAQNRFETGSQKRKPAHYRPTQEKAGLEAGLPLPHKTGLKQVLRRESRPSTGPHRRKQAQKQAPPTREKGAKTGLKQV